MVLEVCVSKIHRWVYRVRSLSDGDCSYQSLLWLADCVVDRKRLCVCHLVFIWDAFEQGDILKALTVSRMKKTVSSHFVKESSSAKSGLHFTILVWSGKCVKLAVAMRPSELPACLMLLYSMICVDSCIFKEVLSGTICHRSNILIQLKNKYVKPWAYLGYSDGMFIKVRCGDWPH